MSEFLADVAQVGDVLEPRGPIGRWFRWDTVSRAWGPVGGTGVVPAVAMQRTAARLGRADLLAVIAVGREPEALPYGQELRRGGASTVFTRWADGTRPPGAPTVEEVAPAVADADVAFVCGSSTRFANTPSPS